MKQAKKMISVFLIIMLALNMTMTFGFAEENVAVTPGEKDYILSNGTINGLTKEYLDSLSPEQKQNIRLVIPDKIDEIPVKGIGAKAFKQNETRYAGCRFIKLDFIETKNLAEIGEYAFNNCNIAEVVIPDSVTTIGGRAFKLDSKGTGLVGTIKMPKSLEFLGVAAFYNQEGLTSVDFNSCDIVIISEQAFRYSGIKGVIYLPSKLKTIETSAFAETGISTVYLPKGMESIIGNAFFSCNELKDIICADYDDYKIVSKTTFSNSGKLTCIFPINFRNEGSTATLCKKPCLVLRAYNYEQQDDGTWCENKAYRFPQIPGKAWSNKKDVPSIRVEKDIITGNFLYQVDAIEKPVIIYSGGIEKIFDGKVAPLFVKAEHPLAVPVSGAQAGNVIFYYTWSWSTIGSTPAVLEGYDKNEYGITDVRAEYPITCIVKVQTCMLNKDNSVTVLYTESHDFTVDIRQATPDLSKIPQGIVKVEESTTTLPDLPTVTGGALTWDAGQTLKPGFNSYAWTFTPNPNAVGSTNYKPMKGKALICPSKEMPTTESVTEQIEKLPQITDDTVIDETIQNSILDAFITVESVGNDIKDTISEDKKDMIYDAIAKLPNVETKVPEESKIKTTDLNNLVRNLTPEEALLLKDQNVKLAIDIKAEETSPTKNDLEVIESLAPDLKIGTSFDINIEKTIGATKGNISELNKPITLTFDVPDELKGAKGLSLIRIHTNVDGTKQAEALADKDTNPNTITVSSDKFSLFAIAYEEKADEPSGGGTVAPKHYVIKASVGTGGEISPKGTVNVYGGFSQSFEIFPDEGYHISKVIVDGKNIGTPKFYTFRDVWSHHAITVEFEKKPPSKNDIIKGVRATTIKAKSTGGKGYIRVTWTKSKGYKVNYYQVFRSKKKTSGYGTKAFYTTKYGTTKSYKNTKSLRKGTRYYYKVRGVRILDGKKYYTKWSTLAYRIAV